MAKYEMLNVSSDTKIYITKQAKNHKKTIVQYMDEVSNYFEKTGVNPADMVILSPAEELKKTRETIISFLRKQEKDFIVPVFSRIDYLAILLTNKFEDKNEEQNVKDGLLSLKESVKPIASIEHKTKIEEQITGESSTKTDDKIQEEYNKLKKEHQLLEQKYKTVCEYFKKVVSNTEFKSTGLNKAPVINLPLGEVNGYKDYLKRM